MGNTYRRFLPSIVVVVAMTVGCGLPLPGDDDDSQLASEVVAGDDFDEPKDATAADATSTTAAIVDQNESVPLGTRGGQAFCDADRDWNAAMGRADGAASDGAFTKELLDSAAIYTTWGERMPVEIAVETVDMNLGFAQVVAVYGETQDDGATRAAYREWRAGPAHRSGRDVVDRWVEQNC